MRKNGKKCANHSFSVDVLDRMDKYCEKTGRIKSIFVEQAIIEKLEREMITPEDIAETRYERASD